MILSGSRGLLGFFSACSSASLSDELVPLFPSVPSVELVTRKISKRGGGGGGGGVLFS